MEIQVLGLADLIETVAGFLEFQGDCQIVRGWGEEDRSEPLFKFEERFAGDGGDIFEGTFMQVLFGLWQEANRRATESFQKENL